MPRKWIIGTVPATGQANWYTTMLASDPNMDEAVERGRVAKKPESTDELSTIKAAMSEWTTSDDESKVVFEIDAKDAVPPLTGLQVFDDSEACRVAIEADPDFTDDP